MRRLCQLAAERQGGAAEDLELRAAQLGALQAELAAVCRGAWARFIRSPLSTLTEHRASANILSDEMLQVREGGAASAAKLGRLLPAVESLLSSATDAAEARFIALGWRI